jgi:dsDNA-specific endonuclease/ATPase MutS2
MLFNLGETVSFLHEEGNGEIIRFENNETAIVLDDTGFERPFPINQLVKIQGTMDYVIDEKNLFQADVSTKKERNNELMKLIQVNGNTWEIDLHSHNILESERGFSSTELLLYQMQKFKSTYRLAIDKKVKKLIVIHGVGKGVLKNEIRDYLAGKEGIEYFDADFRHYGKGATEVVFYPNSSQFY